MLDSLLKFCINLKLKDILDAEMKSRADDTYESPYYNDRLWMQTAWKVHNNINQALFNKIIDDMNLTDAQRELLYQTLDFKLSYEDGKLYLNIITKE